MKIGVIGTIWLNTPPEKYGGTEEVVASLVNGLVDLGHDVTFFGPATAKLKATIYPTVSAPLIPQGISWENTLFTIYHLSEAFDQQDNFDILHFHLNKHQDFAGLPLFAQSRTPVLTTLHFNLVNLHKLVPDKYQLLSKYKHLPYVSISNSQRGGYSFNFIRTVYNSTDLNNYPFFEQPDDYFVWIGKIKPDKGTREAVQIAKKAGIQLRLIGPIDKDNPEHMAYFKKDVKPHIDGKQIIWEGELSLRKKAQILGRARAFLNPLQWDEPFGMVMIESQAVGTPVIAFRRGAAPELIVDGKTGFLVNTASEMIERIGRIGSISRKACREHVFEHFSLEAMLKGYEDSYRKAITLWPTVREHYQRGVERNILTKEKK